MTKKVLVVDDDKTVRLVIGKVAERHGANVTFACDGKEALSALSHGEQFNAVFLDLIMPHLTGWDILNSIRGNEDTATTPVVIVSGAPISEHEKDRLGRQATSFIDKESFDLTTFERMLDSLLDEAETPHE